MRPALLDSQVIPSGALGGLKSRLLLSLLLGVGLQGDELRHAFGRMAHSSI
jgi:hypothetical protein